MAAAMPPDDVSALMTRVKLDRSQYKVFDRRQAGPQNPALEAPNTRANARRPYFYASPQHQAAAPVSAPAQERARPRWSVLNSLLAEEVEDQASVEPEALLVPMLAVSSGPGGVGKSTVLSTMARMLASKGESILMVYPESQRTLALHFGRQQVLPGRVCSFVPPSRSFGELHLYAHPEQEGLDCEEVRDWLPQQANALSSEVGRVFCEASSSTEGQTISLSSVNLRILVPDIASVISVNQDLQNPPEADTYYLLNKYDQSVAFHRDVKDRLSSALGDRLLPFTIRRTDLMAEALASGSTVVDYAADAPVVGDFKKLAKWLRATMHRNEVQPERVLL